MKHSKGNTKVTLRIFIEKPIVYSGCGRVPFRDSDYESLPSVGYYRDVSILLREIYDHFQERVNIEVIDPRNILFLWDVIRYRVKATEPTWLIIYGKDVKYIFRGIPKEEEIEALLRNLLEE